MGELQLRTGVCRNATRKTLGENMANHTRAPLKDCIVKVLFLYALFATKSAKGVDYYEKSRYEILRRVFKPNVAKNTKNNNYWGVKTIYDLHVKLQAIVSNTLFESLQEKYFQR